MCGNWNARQAASQQEFKVTTFCVDTLFQSVATDQSHRTPRCADMSQQAAAATRPIAD